MSKTIETHPSVEILPAKIAVIGGGVSGLVAALKLDSLCDVTIFEANRYVGGHTNTVDVALDNEHHSIDTGFIVFNDRTYPNFVKLLEELGVTSRPTQMSFSLHCDQSGLEYSGTSLNGMFAQRRNLFRPRFYRMIRDILRFNREAAQMVFKGGWENCNEETTVAEFVNFHRYSQEFVQHYLLPMGSAIWSCPVGTFAEFPIRFIVDFYHNHGLLSLRDRPIWRVIDGGSRKYVEAILRKFTGRIYTNTPVIKVRRLEDCVEVQKQHGAPQNFDHVIFACHADQALKLLSDPSAAEKELLAAFPYESNTAVLHTDVSLLPRLRRAWASWNYRLPAASARNSESLPVVQDAGSKRRTSNSNRGATVTYCMNILQHIQSRHVFNVTLNSDENIDSSKILAKFSYAHPVFTAKRMSAQARHGELLNANRTSYCGAYWRNGFHEDGVVSALAVCDRLRRDFSRRLQSPMRRESLSPTT